MFGSLSGLAFQLTFLLFFFITNFISACFNLWAGDWHDVGRNIVLHVLSVVAYWLSLIHWFLGFAGTVALFALLYYGV